MTTRVVLSMLTHFAWISVIVTAHMRVIDILHLVVISKDRAVIDDVTVLSEGTELGRVLLDRA
jgi:hypothetical protein